MQAKHKGQPLVSVILPVYNGGEYVSQAIESVLAQTYKNIELIVVDDGSTDGTRKIIEKFAQQFPAVRGVFLRRNRGESAAANIGFRVSKGEFVARMDADDISYPERIEKQIEFMLQNREVVVLGTQGDIIDQDGNIVGIKTFPLTHAKIYWLYGICHPMLHPSCVFRRSRLPNKKNLWANLREPNDDYYTLFNLLNYGRFANLPASLVGYRIHGNNKSLQKAKSKFFNTFRIRCDAITRLHYKPNMFAIAINILQLVGVLVLPERLIVPLYCLMRGMVQPKFRLNKQPEFGLSVRS